MSCVAPRLVIVTICALPAVPTAWLAKVRLVGVTVTPVPVPVRATVCGLPGALSAIESEALRAPVATGRKVTLMVQELPALRVVPHVVVRLKSAALVPLNEIVPTVMLPLPVLVSVTERTVLLVFNPCVPNASEVGDTLAVGPVPVPLSGTVCGLPEALSVTVRDAARDPIAVGRKVTVMEQFPPTATLVPQVLVWLKSPALVPVIVMLVMLSEAAPVSDRVTIWAAEEVLIA